MSLIRWGAGSELYVYAGENGYVCCQCPMVSNLSINMQDKQELKTHLLKHKEQNHTIGLVGNPLSYQSYEELLDAVDRYDF